MPVYHLLENCHNNHIINDNNEYVQCTPCIILHGGSAPLSPRDKKLLDDGDHVSHICGSLRNQQDTTYTVATQKILNELIYLLAVSRMNNSVLTETKWYSLIL